MVIVFRVEVLGVRGVRGVLGVFRYRVKIRDNP